MKVRLDQPGLNSVAAYELRWCQTGQSVEFPHEMRLVGVARFAGQLSPAEARHGARKPSRMIEAKNACQSLWRHPELAAAQFCEMAAAHADASRDLDNGNAAMMAGKLRPCFIHGAARVTRGGKASRDEAIEQGKAHCPVVGVVELIHKGASFSAQDLVE